MQSITGQKKEIRARCRAIRCEMSTAQKSFADTAIAEKVLQLIEEKRPGRLLCYVSAYPTEVSTTAIIKRALEMQLAVAVPRCIPECSGMDFYLIESASQLISGYCNIPEPDPLVCIKTVPSDGDMCIVPGLSFDSSGFRVGFGGGYYDRMISSCRQRGADVLFVGLCYSSCISGSVPRDEYDQNVSYVITESSVIPISDCKEQS